MKLLWKLLTGRHLPVTVVGHQDGIPRSSTVHYQWPNNWTVGVVDCIVFTKVLDTNSGCTIYLLNGSSLTITSTNKRVNS